MKSRHISIIAVALLLAAFCSSCTVASSGEKDKLTRKGMVIYQYYQYNTFCVLRNYADWGFKLNAWLATPEANRREIEMKYFPNHRIYKDGENIYGLYKGNVLEYTINTQGHALSDVNADWIITWKNDVVNYREYENTQSFSQDLNEMHITHVADASRNAWNVTIADEDSAQSYLNIVVEPEGAGEYIAESLFEWNFSITGSGCYKFVQDIWQEYKNVENETCLQFNIEESMPWCCNYDIIAENRCPYYQYHWRGGKVALVASNNKGESVPVYAMFKGIYNIAITYKDVTEIWNIEEERDLY